jgi:hypothetical protein
MSYDLAVFDPSGAPRDPAEFGDWLYSEENASADVFNDPSGTTDELRAFYLAMVQKFPDYNDDSFDPDTATDYATGYEIGSKSIVMEFRWTKAEEAYEAVRLLAVEHRVGFFDQSGDGSIHFPGEELQPPSQGVWRQVAADFKAGDMSRYSQPSEQPKRRWFDFFRRDK